MRILFNNCGGIPVDHMGEKHAQIITLMKDMKADFLSIQEHNLNLEIMTGRNTWKN